MNTLWFFLPGILYLGIASSYTDIKFGKIKNRDILAGIFYALAVYIGLIVFNLAKGGSIDYFYFLELGTNTLFSLAVAFGLWHYKIWSAGDGKLFFAFSLIIPLNVYVYDKYAWFPALTLLFNMLIAGLFLMALLIIKNARHAHYKKVALSFAKQFIKPSFFLESVISLFVIYWAIQLLLSFAGLRDHRFLQYIITIIIFSQWRTIAIKFSDKYPRFKFLGPGIIIFLAFLRFAIDRSIYTLDFLIDFALLLLFWRIFKSIFREGVHKLGVEVFTKKIRISRLKPGMIISDKIFKAGKLEKNTLQKMKGHGMKIVNKGKHSYLIGNSGYDKIGFLSEEYINTESEGLTKNDIKALKKTGLKSVNVSASIPFAPIVFVGVLATLLIKGNILILWVFLFG